LKPLHVHHSSISGALLFISGEGTYRDRDPKRQDEVTRSRNIYSELALYFSRSPKGRKLHKLTKLLLSVNFRKCTKHYAASFNYSRNRSKLSYYLYIRLISEEDSEREAGRIDVSTIQYSPTRCGNYPYFEVTICKCPTENC